MLEGNIPFHDMKSLEYLDLSYNSFTGSVPSFSQDTPLIKLILNNNNINKQLPIEWENRYVPYTYNFYHYVRKSYISPYLKELDTIDLSYNNIDSSFNDYLNPLLSLANLRELHLRGNKLKYL